MKYSGILLVLALLSIAGCDGPFRTPWHAETLASGSTIKVTSLNLVWGGEHDEHALGQDCFALEYVTSYPGGDAKQREAEGAEAFELVRPASELWGFRTASLAAYPTLERKGHYDLYLFERQPDGKWSFTRTDTKVFANDK